MDGAADAGLTVATLSGDDTDDNSSSVGISEVICRQNRRKRDEQFFLQSTPKHFFIKPLFAHDEDHLSPAPIPTIEKNAGGG